MVLLIYRATAQRLDGGRPVGGGQSAEMKTLSKAMRGETKAIMSVRGLVLSHGLSADLPNWAHSLACSCQRCLTCLASFCSSASE